ncbi:hypothetical protein EK21DRAFT_103128 [Setomelanomma holmii]|uniref:DNA-binding protein RAP1 n=1 Tax=Setomelanomma holmii TaxID=210430 RepID=A0A9P4LJH0_9PLEO|nr:hypothetical protein EK21DRAFT_103128 [Setomelanomma holmii]
MAAPTVFNNVVEGFELEGVGQLFAGKKFWVAQRVPSRNRLLDDIKANGGEIVMLEKKSDYRIADHFRKDCPPGSISYEFVEKSIQEGRIRDPEDHLAGPAFGEAREPGAINRPAKGGRAAYTPEEDRILYKWVRDCEQTGGLASGNEIYKQLEAKYPRHTWQSWRDRYLKQLRDRPPSAFNIPDNAPPSPPSETPAEQQPPTATSIRPAKKPATRKQQSQATKVSGEGKVRDSREVLVDYSLDQLAATFNSDDWEELYAFVDIVYALKEGENGEMRYEEAWGKWAESQDNQTPNQWRQYFEKVVRPQWLRDPEWKRLQIRQNIDKKHATDASQSQSISQQQQQDADEHPALLMAEWDALSTEEKAPYLARNQDAKQQAQAETSRLTCEVKLMSSATAQYESPRIVAEIMQNVLKRVRGDEIIKEVAQEIHPPKRRKSASPGMGAASPQPVQESTIQPPIEVISSDTSTSDSRPEADDERADNQIRQEFAQRQNIEGLELDEDVQETELDTDSIKSEDFLDIDRLPPPPEGMDEASEDDLPSNTPTPRAARQHPNNFDTQAILSSPSQGIGITALPRPVGYTQDLETQHAQRSSSLAPHPESEASTTQSLQEFRTSLNSQDAKVSYPTLGNLPRPTSLSPAPSSSSSTGSGDPDMPLDANEFDGFFDEKMEDGFSNEFIVRALKRTRFRPHLAEIVLEAWGQGKPLPTRRGIWSLEDDEAVEGGDGVVLAKLERKHTMDGWGGITERLRFLEDYRSR